MLAQHQPQSPSSTHLHWYRNQRACGTRTREIPAPTHHTDEVLTQSSARASSRHFHCHTVGPVVLQVFVSKSGHGAFAVSLGSSGEQQGNASRATRACSARASAPDTCPEISDSFSGISANSTGFRESSSQWPGRPRRRLVSSARGCRASDATVPAFRVSSAWPVNRSADGGGGSAAKARGEETAEFVCERMEEGMCEGKGEGKDSAKRERRCKANGGDGAAVEGRLGGEGGDGNDSASPSSIPKARSFDPHTSTAAVASARPRPASSSSPFSSRQEGTRPSASARDKEACAARCSIARNSAHAPARPAACKAFAATPRPLLAQRRPQTSPAVRAWDSGWRSA
eukprot:6139993-Pleurochrysis_carterae.AAC.1